MVEQQIDTGSAPQEDFQDIIEGGDIMIDGEDDGVDFEVANHGAGNEDDDYFDQVVGSLQELILDPEFETMQKKFSTSNCLQFEATEENKLCYMTIFQEYTSTIESYINTKLSEMVDNFSMERFVLLLDSRQDQIEESIYDLLLSFSDFESFKEMMLFARAHLVATTPKQVSSKAASLGLKSSAQLAAERVQTNPSEESKDGENVGIVGQSAVVGQAQKMRSSDLVHFETCIDGLQISGRATQIYQDEQIDGEERPDLNLNIVGQR